jgi:hypothetical protein
VSEEELPELAEVEPAFVRRAVRTGALEPGGPADSAPRTPSGCGSCGPGTRIPRPDHLEPLGPVELKGLAHPLEVFRALA